MFAFLGLVPLALLTYFAVHLSDQAVVREVNARVKTTSVVSAVLVAQEMQSLEELTASYAGRYRLTNALADGNPAHFDNTAVDLQLSDVAAARPGIAGAALADTSCRLDQVEPPSPSSLGLDLSGRDWCKGVTATGRPYVSSAYRTALAGHALVVAVATTVRANGAADGRPLGILLIAYPLHEIQALADHLAGVEGIRLVITDQHGAVLAGATGSAAGGSLASAANDPRVGAALAGRSGVSRSWTAYGDTLSAFSPVAQIGWTVTAEVPASVALAGVRQLRSTVLIVAGLLGLGLLAGLLRMARTLELRREAERALREQEASTRAILKAGIAERRRAEVELSAARDQALEASRLKSQFLANMSHEIRTPLNGVLGMTSLLLDSDLGVEQREFAETVRMSGEVLLVLLNDILDFSKIEAGHLDLESIDFDLRTLVEDVAGLLSLPAHSKGLELACSLPVGMPATFRGDPGRLRQVLTNLVGNAVKFTSSGEVVLELSIGDERDDTAIARFQVLDTGIGIAAADQPGLFDLFSQVDASTTRRFGGTGLGLAISRQLVELMGGQIGVSSEIGIGSRFWFTVPLQSSQRGPEVLSQAALAGLRMLVVDDNATNRAILTRFLRAWGIRPDAVDGAAEAQRVLAASVAERDPFDVVLLDLNMPDVDGIELARRIAADSTLPSPKMVLLTSSGVGGEAREAREAGIAGYLTKPVRQSQLYDCLVTVMDGSRSAAASNRTPIADPRSAKREASGHVLLVEDNAVNQRVAESMLHNLGYRVDVMADGAQAVKAATVTAYQAILMDCQMPVMDGYEATGEIRRLQGRSRHTPIIAVTASAMQSDQQRCLAAGMDGYITKPLSLKALAAVLARVAPEGSAHAIAGDSVQSAAGSNGATAGHARAAGPALDPEIVDRLERLGEDIGEDLMGQLTTLFLADAGVHADAIRQALADHDTAGVVRSAHTLSGASGSLGASALARLCTTLETNSAAENLRAGDEQLDALEFELGRVRLALSSRTPTSSRSS